MEENPFEKSPTRENTPKISLELATSSDWKIFQALKLEALQGKDGVMFGVTPENQEKRLNEERRRGKRGWKRILIGDYVFGVLAWSDKEPIGIGLAEYREKEHDWYLYSGYVKEDFRGGAGKKIFAKRLQEIIQRGGKTVSLSVKKKNTTSIKLAESFGFKRLQDDSSSEGFEMQLKDATSPEIILKINEVLDEG